MLPTLPQPRAPLSHSLSQEGEDASDADQVSLPKASVSHLGHGGWEQEDTTHPQDQGPVTAQRLCSNPTQQVRVGAGPLLCLTRPLSDPGLL